MRCRRAPFVLPASVEADLVARYSEPHRAYHDTTHIAELLAWFDALDWARPAEVYAAMLYHDAVYDPTRSDNEARSAELARASGLPVDVDRVVELILLTARHGGLDDVRDPDTAHFLDADMAILGADPERFDRYDAAIRREYAHVPDEAFRAGRRAFLAKVLAKPRIYFSADFHARLDAAARANLERTVARLA
jgi:predicted metal-dependent HD superfamily phosphohydrolase